MRGVEGEEGGDGQRAEPTDRPTEGTQYRRRRLINLMVNGRHSCSLPRARVHRLALCTPVLPCCYRRRAAYTAAAAAVTGDRVAVAVCSKLLRVAYDSRTPKIYLRCLLPLYPKQLCLLCVLLLQRICFCVRLVDSSGVEYKHEQRMIIRLVWWNRGHVNHFLCRCGFYSKHVLRG